MPIAFDVSIAEWVKKAKENADVAFRGTAEGAVGRVKELTPVRTGYLRANWSAVLDGQQVPVEGAANATTAAIAEAKVGDRIVIVNPVKYAPRIEFGFAGEDKNGRSIHTEGRHMVQQTVTEIPAIAEQVVRDLQGKR